MGRKDNSNLAQLRKVAEETLHSQAALGSSDQKDIKLLMQELQVHQIELELQNDELTKANDEVELQRIKFENIYDLAPVGYFILNYHGIIEEVNAAGTTLLETGKDSLKGKRLAGFVKPDDDNSFFTFYKGLQKTHTKQQRQFAFINKNGREFYGLVQGRYVQAGSKLYIAISDMTEGIETGLRLTETRDRLELALEAASAGTWELHYPAMNFYLDETNYKLCNAGQGRFDQSYTSFINLVHPEDRFEVDQHFRSAINNESKVELICRFISADGEVCFASIRGHLVKTSAGKEMRFVGIMSDITGQVKRDGLAEDEKRARQQEITTAALSAEEKERKRISEMLHDSVSQLLYGIRIQLSQANQENLAEAKRNLNSLLDMAIKETRNISFELAPPVLADFGLEETVKELCNRLSTSELQISAYFSGFRKRLDLSLENTIFRIVQELVNNCMKHSGATEIRIDLKRSKTVELTVRDNGKGFKKPKKSNPHATGITSIKNRIDLYHGTIDIKSVLGQGTVVTVTMKV